MLTQMLIFLSSAVYFKPDSSVDVVYELYKLFKGWVVCVLSVRNTLKEIWLDMYVKDAGKILAGI